MSDKIKVCMTAYQRVELSKVVEMDRKDYDEYVRLCGSDLRARELDKRINDIASRYGLDGEQVDWDEMEETTFEPA